MSAIPVAMLNDVFPAGTDAGAARAHRSRAADGAADPERSFERVWEDRRATEPSAEPHEAARADEAPERAEARAPSPPPAEDNRGSEPESATDAPEAGASPTEPPPAAAPETGSDGAKEAAPEDSLLAAGEGVLLDVTAQGVFDPSLLAAALAVAGHAPDGAPTGQAGAAADGRAPMATPAPWLGEARASSAAPGAGSAPEGGTWPIRTAQELLALLASGAGTASQASQGPATPAVETAAGQTEPAGRPAKPQTFAAVAAAGQESTPLAAGAGTPSASAAATVFADASAPAEAAPAPSAAGARATATQVAALAAAEAGSAESPAVEVSPASSPAPAGPARGPASPTAATVADQVAEGIRTSGTPADREIVVRLHPPELGRVRITLESKDGAIRGVVRVDSPDTLEKLQQEAGPLLGRLQADGVNVRRLDVLLNPDQPGGEHGHPGAFAQGETDPQGAWTGANGQPLAESDAAAEAADPEDEAAEAVARGGSVNVQA